MRAPEPPQEPKPLATAKLVVRKVKPASELNKPKLKRWVELIDVSWAFWVLAPFGKPPFLVHSSRGGWGVSGGVVNVVWVCVCVCVCV